MASKLILVTLALACMVAGTAAISCNVCEYSNSAFGASGNDCNDPYSGTTDEFDCGESVTYCAKSKSSGEVFGVKFDSVTRTCGTMCTKTGSSEVDLLGVKATVHCCDTANCNAAGAILPTLTILLASLALTRVF